MNFQLILLAAQQFQKLAYQLNPFRNIKQDIMHALEHASNNGVYLFDDRDIMEIPLEWLNINKIEKFPLRDLLRYDDFDSWKDSDYGELKRE